MCTRTTALIEECVVAKRCSPPLTLHLGRSFTAGYTPLESILESVLDREPGRGSIQFFAYGFIAPTRHLICSALKMCARMYNGSYRHALWRGAVSPLATLGRLHFWAALVYAYNSSYVRVQQLLSKHALWRSSVALSGTFGPLSCTTRPLEAVKRLRTVASGAI